MKILFVASEVDPFAKTGGLADVAAALPKALSRMDHDVRIVMPRYRQVSRQRYELKQTAVLVSVRVGETVREGRLWQGALPNSRVPIYFVDCEELFNREGLYQDRGNDYPDNLERFSFFSQAALQILPALSWRPDVVHCHDWQTSLVCAHLALGPWGHEPFFSSTGTVLTVHNLAYQGVFPKTQWALTQLPQDAFSIHGLEFYDQVNCLKGGLVSAGVLTTVSPTYVREIQTPEFGCGLEGVLQGRTTDLIGILNGIDPEEWNPQTDPHTNAHYSADELAGKSLCKLALQKQQGLPERHELLIGMIQRLAEQKGIDIFVEAIEQLMILPLQLVILGTGDLKYHRQLEQVAARFPDRLRLNVKFDNTLAHQIEAGADAFLMPSRFEPCGLNQMYSMRFGTVPIVKRVGGLADTVTDLTPDTRAAKTATGFVFAPHTASALVEAVKRALTAFRDHDLWKSLIQAGMRRDFSWSRSANEYVQVYERAVAKAKERQYASRH